MGVWIETAYVVIQSSVQQSHPVWVCGLKHFMFQLANLLVASHPVWVCGLKHNLIVVLESSSRSHPVWVCGLKPSGTMTLLETLVTPCMGVWIETSLVFVLG